MVGEYVHGQHLRGMSPYVYGSFVSTDQQKMLIKKRYKIKILIKNIHFWYFQLSETYECIVLRGVDMRQDGTDGMEQLFSKGLYCFLYN